MKLSGKISLGIGAIAIFIAIISMSFNGNFFQPSSQQKQTPPPGWTW